MGTDKKLGILWWIISKDKRSIRKIFSGLKKRLFEYYVYFYLKFLLLRYNINCNIKKDYSGLKKWLMLYEFIENTISYNIPEIKYYALQEKINFKDALQICMAHEIGHYIDMKVKKNIPDLLRPFLDENYALKRPEYSKIVLPEKEAQIIRLFKEENAYEYGKKYVPKKLLKPYIKLNERMINHYKTTLDKTE